MTDTKRKQSSQNEFLGGGPKFNRVGTDNKATGDANASTDDTGPILVPTKITPYGVRTLIIVIVITLLVSILYFFAQSNGVYQGKGRRSTDPADVVKARQPQSNF